MGSLPHITDTLRALSTVRNQGIKLVLRYRNRAFVFPGTCEASPPQQHLVLMAHSGGESKLQRPFLS